MKKICLVLILASIVVPFDSLTNNALSSTDNHDSHTEVNASPVTGDGLDKAKSLVRYINQYRREKGLDEVPYSPWLTYVARWHVYDLENNHRSSGPCNSMHSWSDKGEGKWNQCCKRVGDAGACSWDKPKEISKGAYKGVGFEIACGGRDIDEMTNDAALQCWKSSSSHLDIMLNRGTWADNKWRAIGAGISHHYAVVWFAEESDTSKE